MIFEFYFREFFSILQLEIFLLLCIPKVYCKYKHFNLFIFLFSGLIIRYNLIIGYMLNKLAACQYTRLILYRVDLFPHNNNVAIGTSNCVSYLVYVNCDLYIRKVNTWL